MMGVISRHFFSYLFMITEFLSVFISCPFLLLFFYSIIPDCSDSEPSDIFPGFGLDDKPIDPCRTPLPDTPSDVRNDLLSLADCFTTVASDSVSWNRPNATKPFVPILTSTAKKFTQDHPKPVTTLQTASEPKDDPSSDSDKTTPQANPIYGGHRSSLLETRISKEERERLFAEADKPIRFSKSVNQQHQKVEPIFLHFCKEMDIQEPYPIITRTLIAFLIWIAESLHFTVKSIDTVFYASLARLNIARSGRALDPVSQYSARALIAALYRDPNQKKARGGMKPIIPDDVARMVSAMDMRQPLSYALASLFNFALASGARGNSCGAVRLKDVGPLFDISETESIVIITLVKIKAHPQECIQLALGGCIEVKSPLDVMYWLNQHLLHNFSTTLRDVASGKWGESRDGNECLWDYTTDQMTQFVKLRLLHAGIDPDHFGFHSFRSGFLASCLIQGQGRDQSLEEVLTRCAIITGWKPKGEIQFGYIREDARRHLLTTNLIGTTNMKSTNALPSFPTTKDSSGSPLHVNSFEYHLLKPLPPPTNRKSYLSCVKSILSKRLWVKGATTFANKHYVSTCYQWYLWHIGSKLYKDQQVQTDGGEVGKKRINFRTLGFRYLDQQTSSGNISMEALAEQIYQTLKEKNKLRQKLPEPFSIKPAPLLPPTRRMVKRKGGMVRKRVEWSDVENTILMNGIEKNLTAREIARQLPIRTEHDVYFHVLHLNKQRAKTSLPPLHLIGGPRVRTAVSPSKIILISDSDSSSSSVSSTAKRRPPPRCGRSQARSTRVASSSVRSKRTSQSCSSRKSSRIRSSRTSRVGGKRKANASSDDSEAH